MYQAGTPAEGLVFTLVRKPCFEDMVAKLLLISEPPNGWAACAARPEMATDKW